MIFSIYFVEFLPESIDENYKSKSITDKLDSRISELKNNSFCMVSLK